MTKQELLDALSDFKSARDAVLHADSDDFSHHLKSFVRQLDQNPLCVRVLSGLPPFNADEWWKKQLPDASRGRRHIDSLDLPAGKDDQVSAFIDLVRSFASGVHGQLSVEGFGIRFGMHKKAEAIGIAESVVIRPLVEELTRRVRDAVAMANPDIRELAGVPLARIPKDDELGIFLSHKSVNKDRVRRYRSALRQIGFDPWLDEDRMTAGQVLHRAIEAGMAKSCAAVFFVTPEFKDDRWLEQEIDLAVTRRVEQGTRFQIVTLVFDSAEIPRPLQKYVYQSVDNDLDGLRELIRALPIELGLARWKSHAIEDR